MADEATTTTSADAGQADAAAQPQGQVADFQAALDERFDALTDRIGDLVEAARSQVAPSAQDDYDPDPYDDYYLADDYGEDAPSVQDGGFDQQAFMRTLRGEITKLINEAVAPLSEQVENQRIEAEAAQLEEQYPELRDPDVLRNVADEAEQVAKALRDDSLAHEPKIIELVYLAQKARAAAASETPAGTTAEVALESGGASPQTGKEHNPAMDIVNAGRPGAGFLFEG